MASRRRGLRVLTAEADIEEKEKLRAKEMADDLLKEAKRLTDRLKEVLVDLEQEIDRHGE